MTTFTPPVLNDGSPLSERDRSATRDGRVTNEWRVPEVNPIGYRLMSFYSQRPVGVTVYKMDDGTYRSDRPVPGVLEGPPAWPPLPIADQVNGAINQAWLDGEIVSEQVQSPAVVFVYYGGGSYQVDANEAAALTAAGLGAYLT
jgi:hypothetical protein